MRSRITLAHPVNTKQADGSLKATSYTDYATGIPADIQTLSVTQLMLARQVFANVTSKIRVRHRTGIKPNDRIVSGTPPQQRIFFIRGPIDVDNRNIWLDLMCEELTNGT